MGNKDGAFEFLVGLETKLKQELPAPPKMRARMADLSEEGKSPSKIRENIFLYHILPVVSEHMQTIAGISAKEACDSLLCEYYSQVPTIASGNPFRRVGHPFRKNAGMSADEIMKMWTKAPGSLPLNQAYPDFCLRPPFPFKIVFDAKYFLQASEVAATKALVEGAYEVMFYRGLPAVSTQVHDGPDWDYEFGCLLAYDASDQGILKKTWASVTCKNTFWDGANVFMMII